MTQQTLNFRADAKKGILEIFFFPCGKWRQDLSGQDGTRQVKQNDNVNFNSSFAEIQLLF